MAARCASDGAVVRTRSRQEAILHEDTAAAPPPPPTSRHHCPPPPLWSAHTKRLGCSTNAAEAGAILHEDAAATPGRCKNPVEAGVTLHDDAGAPSPGTRVCCPPLLSVCYVFFYVCPSVLSCFFLFVFIHVYMFVLNCCMCTGFLVEAGVLPFPLLVLQRSFLQAPCLPARDRHDLPCPLEDYVAPSSLLEITSFILKSPCPAE